jgi:hypothetical protein
VSDSTFVADALRATAAELFGGADRHVSLATLVDLGWSELANEDLAVAVSVLAEEQGRQLGVSRLVELAMCAATPALFDPEFDALVFAIGPDRGTTFADGAAIDGVVLADGGGAARFVVPTSSERGVTLHALASQDVDAVTVSGIDPDARVTRVRCTIGSSADPLAPGAWERSVAVGSLAVAHEVLGVVDAMLDLAIAHVSERHQFGVAIGSFQAVQHRLADVRVDAAAAHAVCRMAWIDRDRFICAAARSAAGRAFETATRHCQQVMGAMGSTWEHRLHRYQRHGLLLGRLLDPAPTLREALATVVIDQRRVEVLES